MFLVFVCILLMYFDFLREYGWDYVLFDSMSVYVDCKHAGCEFKDVTCKSATSF